MQEQLANQIIAKLEPAFYTIGMIIVFLILTFGSTIIGLWVKMRSKQSEKSEEILSNIQILGAQHTLQISKLETKLDIYIEKYNTDLKNLGNKIRSLDT